jgi:beta-glucosidase/6-phospho-beta-glucosidase/beta-galactosidase
MSNSVGKTFASFFQAGFECSSHRRRDGVRLDLIRATGHDKHVLQDYRLCRQLGFSTLRDGLRWHLIEQSPGKYDWSSWLPALEAAELTGVQIIWDLFHYGSPDHVDQAANDFPERFTDFALAALEVQQSVSGRPPFVCPLNEINFLSWAVDDEYFPRVGPNERGWFKRQLVSTAVMSARAIKQRWPKSTIVWAEPLIHIAPHDRRRRTVRAAEQNLQGMYEAYDWIMGLAEPELGGDPSLVDLIGLNFYPHNQWYYKGPTIPMGHHEYRPLADMLVEMAERYGKPVFLSETGAEGSGKPSWLHYVCNEVRDAMSRGADIRGICWYPITAYPGWDNSRHAETGLLSTVVADGTRHVDEGLLTEFEVQRQLFAGDLDALGNRRRLRLV